MSKLLLWILDTALLVVEMIGGLNVTNGTIKRKTGGNDSKNRIP